MYNSSKGDVQDPICLWPMPSEVKQEFTRYFAIGIVNIVLAITASSGNILILVALQKEFTLSAQSRVLFRSLATSDLSVGLISQPLYAASILLLSNEHHWDVCRSIRQLTYVVSTTLCGVSLLTLTAISMDRLLVLLLRRYKYRKFVTRGRVKAVVGCFWITSFAISFVDLKNRRVFFIVTGLGIMLNIALSTFSYFTIFVLRRRQNRIYIVDSRQQVNSFQFNRSQRFKKTVYSVLWVHFTMVFCYFPYSVLEAIVAITGTTFSLPILIGGSCLVTLIYLNSSISPFLYCWRINEVRQAVKQIFS